MTVPKIRLATASPATKATKKESLNEISKIARQAASEKADILLLPEAYLGGYPRGSGFGSVVGNRSVEGREEFLKYFKAAVDLGDTVGNGAGAGAAWLKKEIGGGEQKSQNRETGQHVTPTRGDGTREELERIARDTGVFIVVGLVEKAGGSLYCSAVYVCPTLGVIGKRRKVMPTGTERLIWAQGSPSTLKAVSTTIRGVRINLAVAICWESYMPLLRQALYAQNINLYLAPTADGRDSWVPLLRTIALEGRCAVVSSNMCVRSEQSQTFKNSSHAETSGADGSGGLKGARETTKARRNSCLTEDGFEIALPTHSANVKRARRRSVFDEDGNEIVLCGNSDVAVVEEESPLQEAGSQAQTNGTKKSTSFISRGGSCIISPYGEVVAGPQWEDDEGIIYADIDFDDCIRGRLDLDAAGSYSRNDSFKFSVEGLDLDPLPY